MWPFNKKTSEQPQLPPALLDDAFDMLAMVKSDRLNEAIGKEVRKAFSIHDFQGMENLDNQGAYFNREFDLRPTAGRVKALHSSEPWVYATSSLIARTLAAVPLAIVDNATNEVVDVHDGYKIIDGGNAWMDATTKRWSGYLDLCLGGNYFEVLDENFETSMHVPVESVNLRMRKNNTDEERSIIASEGPIEGIEILDYYEGGGQGHFIPWEQVIHHKFPNPFNPFYGLSMYVAASRPILLDRHKNEFEMAFYLRGATNAGVIETTEDITKKRMDRLMSTFEQAFTGKRNWWRTMFLPKGAKWVNSGLTMSEMQHLEGLRENRRTLLAVLGIPPTMVGIVEDVNRATSEVQERAFYENTIMPLASFIAAGYNNSYLFRNIYGGDVRVEPDFSNIEAIQGSTITRGERAKALDNIAVLNEQREIAGLDPLPDIDPRGNMLLAEIQKLGMDPFGVDITAETDGMELATPTIVSVGSDPAGTHTHRAEIDIDTGLGKTISTQGDVEDHEHQIHPKGDGKGEVLEADGHTHPDVDIPQRADHHDERDQAISRVKAAATRSQRRIERIQARRYIRVLANNTDMLIDAAIRALKAERNVANVIAGEAELRAEKYRENGMPILWDTTAKAFTMAMSQTRSLTNSLSRVTKGKDKLTPDDEQALAAIQERTEDGTRKRLDERNIQAFMGFDSNESEHIVRLVEQGFADGKTFGQIAADIRQQHSETYLGQAHTIARTEVLTAVSEGQKWNHDALREIYSEVGKQWFHVGDAGSNPDARQQHADFEDVGKRGVVKSDYVWVNSKTGARLRYPRDPNAGAADIINCRCTMVSVIPDNATSNAGTILEGS